MNKLFIFFVSILIVFPLWANTIVVDQNGGGQFTTIQAAINAASSGDTVKVWPGYYDTEQVNLNKNITLMGSGYENTVITGNFNPTILMSSGKLQWFQISSTGGRGIDLSGGTVKNCVIVGSSSHGINVPSGTSQIINCVLYQNGGYGIYALSTGVVNVTNCISRVNGSGGFYGDTYPTPTLNLSYSNGSRTYTTGNQGCVDCDPPFTSPPVDFHIGENSSCSWNTGSPSLFDPDGSRSDMGYFGGPDCPIYPTVFEILIEPNGNNINLKAKARANY